jgi:aryl-alcohol dehydrogenase-like predicted oxidoreductase
MKFRSLGSTGMDVSVLGFGTVKLGRDQGVKYPGTFTIPDDREAQALLNLARDLGINLIDTAPAYGNSEERLGKLLKGQRQSWIIGSKCGEEFVNGASQFDFSEPHIVHSVERSLKRLNTDYLDLVLIHSDGNDLHILQNTPALETLANLKQQGKIRAIGMSTKTIEGGLLAARHSDVVMVTYNLHEQQESEVLDYCQQHHKGVLIKKALGSGHLPLVKNHPDPVATSLQFVLQHQGVSSVIIGTISPQNLRHNVECVLRYSP